MKAGAKRLNKQIWNSSDETHKNKSENSKKSSIIIVVAIVENEKAKFMFQKHFDYVLVTQYNLKMYKLWFVVTHSNILKDSANHYSKKCHPLICYLPIAKNAPSWNLPCFLFVANLYSPIIIFSQDKVDLKLWWVSKKWKYWLQNLHSHCLLLREDQLNAKS